MRYLSYEPNLMRITEPPVRSYVAPRLGGRRGTDNYAAQVARNKRRRMQELLQENYKEVKIDVPPAFIKGNQARPGKTVNSRRVLALKRSLANVFDDDPSNSALHAKLAAKPSKYPSKPRCVVCGYFSSVTCTKCTSKACGLKCLKGHQCVVN